MSLPLCGLQLVQSDRAVSLVRCQVHLQSALCYETSCTEPTFERFLRGVSVLVNVEAGLRFELLGADGAAEGPHSGVDCRVSLQLTLGPKLFRAKRAPERLLPGVNPHVFFKPPLRGEVLLANSTLKRPLSRVANAHVVLQRFLFGKILFANGTLDSVVGPHVLPEGFLSHVRLWTERTAVWSLTGVASHVFG